MCGTGCGCEPCRSKGGRRSSSAAPPMLRGFAGPPVDVPSPQIPASFRARVESAATVGDVATILAASWAKLRKVREHVTETYVGGKHEDEAPLAARKLAISEQLDAVRVAYAQALATLDAMEKAGTITAGSPIPPSVAYLVRPTAGYAVPTPMALAPWILAADFAELAKDAEDALGGNLPKLPPGVPEPWGEDFGPILLILAAVFLLGTGRIQLPRGRRE